jgi:prevent-host-death family protein
MIANRIVNITEFKAKCLSIFDEVEAGKTSITVTRRGKVVGVVNPPAKEKYKSARDSWKDKIEIEGDVVNVDFSDMFDVVNGRSWDHQTAIPRSKEKPELARK